jgi:hypothetical protein
LEVGMAAAPLPKKQVEMDEKIDEAIAKIDAALPVIHQRAAAAKEAVPAAGPPSPSRPYPVKNFMRTQQMLSKLANEMKESDTFDAVTPNGTHPKKKATT